MLTKYSNGNTSVILPILLCLILVSCFAPRYKWEYWLPDKNNAAISIGGYEVIISITAFKEFQKNTNPDYIVYSVFFETHYGQKIKDTLSMDTFPSIAIESAHIVLLPSNDTTYLGEHIRDLDPIDKDWVGPGFGEEIKIHKNQKDLIIGFTVHIKDQVTKEIIESKKYKFELTQFYDRYWITAQ